MRNEELLGRILNLVHETKDCTLNFVAIDVHRCTLGMSQNSYSCAFWVVETLDTTTFYTCKFGDRRNSEILLPHAKAELVHVNSFYDQKRRLSSVIPVIGLKCNYETDWLLESFPLICNVDFFYFRIARFTQRCRCEDSTKTSELSWNLTSRNCQMSEISIQFLPAEVSQLWEISETNPQTVISTIFRNLNDGMYLIRVVKDTSD